MTEAKELPTSEDIGKLFEKQAKREKKNVVQSVGNQNPWKDELPPEEILEHHGRFVRSRRKLSTAHVQFLAAPLPQWTVLTALERTVKDE